jgi:CheY-like chemotaxis protein
VKKCVLIADDHEIVRAKIASTFKSHGFEVRDAANGAEAVTKAQEAHPDLIVLDLAMPVMNGFEAARMLQALHAGSSFDDVLKPYRADSQARGTFRWYFRRYF